MGRSMGGLLGAGLAGVLALGAGFAGSASSSLSASIVKAVMIWFCREGEGTG